MSVFLIFGWTFFEGKSHLKLCSQLVSAAKFCFWSLGVLRPVSFLGLMLVHVKTLEDVVRILQNSTKSLIVRLALPLPSILAFVIALWLLLVDKMTAVQQKLQRQALRADYVMPSLQTLSCNTGNRSKRIWTHAKYLLLDITGAFIKSVRAFTQFTHLTYLSTYSTCFPPQKNCLLCH